MPSLALPAAPRRLSSTLLCLILAWGVAPSYGAPTAPAPQPHTTSAAAAAPTSTSGRSRAEVMAELACARASGELDAMVLRSYGQPTPRLRPEACAADHVHTLPVEPPAVQSTPQSAH